ncbi:MAG: nitrogenase cofactor biosynthesis protein NifB, partial [Nitrospirae bacterium]|nr:nitrogenase cofactor biosynthesis protein NifB [Nitrospirota bacterium]
MSRSSSDILKTHPCFSAQAHETFGRIHLAVAPACNIQCRYCERKYDCANESRPGVSSTVLDPAEAVERVEAFIERNDRVSVVGIAGPGDPLANASTFETLTAIHRKFPDLTLCVSTNGLLLAERLGDLVRAGVRSVTVTINAVSPQTAERVYEWVLYRGKKLTGIQAAETLVRNQWQGLINAIEAGLLVKVNSVYIPGVNDSELIRIAKLAGSFDADIMNVLPLIPQAQFKQLSRPSYDMLHTKRDELRPFIKQMSHCRQCRADACGTLGEDKDMELELLQSRIGIFLAD